MYLFIFTNEIKLKMLKQIVIMQELAAFLITIVILNATAHVQIYTQDPHAELVSHQRLNLKIRSLMRLLSKIICEFLKFVY